MEAVSDRRGEDANFDLESRRRRRRDRVNSKSKLATLRELAFCSSLSLTQV